MNEKEYKALYEKAKPIIRARRKGEKVTDAQLAAVNEYKAARKEIYAQKENIKLGSKRDSRKFLPFDTSYDQEYYKKFNSWIKRVIKGRILGDIEAAKKAGSKTLSWGLARDQEIEANKLANEKEENDRKVAAEKRKKESAERQEEEAKEKTKNAKKRLEALEASQKEATERIEKEKKRIAELQAKK